MNPAIRLLCLCLLNDEATPESAQLHPDMRDRDIAANIAEAIRALKEDT